MAESLDKVKANGAPGRSRQQPPRLWNGGIDRGVVATTHETVRACTEHNAEVVSLAGAGRQRRHAELAAMEEPEP